jgi:hypothetical protein
MTIQLTAQRLLLAATLVTGSIVAAAAPAQAAPAQHCVAATTSSPNEISAAPVCFSTFAGAIAHATGGSVRLPAGATTVTEQELRTGYAKLAATDDIGIAAYVVGISYRNSGYQGSTFTHTASRECDNDVEREFYYRLPSDWNNQISSAKGYALCTGTYFDGVNAAGTQGSGAKVDTNWSGGAMNDHAAFIQWR